MEIFSYVVGLYGFFLLAYCIQQGRVPRRPLDLLLMRKMSKVHISKTYLKEESPKLFWGYISVYALYFIVFVLINQPRVQSLWE